VAQVAIIGLPDDHWGEVVCAVVVATADTTPDSALDSALDSAELIAWTKDKITGFKRPRVVVVVAELPVNASGKVDKALLRAMHSAAQ
jgi:acyl-CoA synthetase (AMP-forming)/AMP-acid ligase II